MEEEADCGDGCRFKGKEVGSVIFFYVKIAFRKTVFLPDLFFFVYGSRVSSRPFFRNFTHSQNFHVYYFKKDVLALSFHAQKIEIFHVKHFNSMHSILDE